MDVDVSGKFCICAVRFEGGEQVEVDSFPILFDSHEEAAQALPRAGAYLYGETYDDLIIVRYD